MFRVGDLNPFVEAWRVNILGRTDHSALRFSLLVSHLLEIRGCKINPLTKPDLFPIRPLSRRG